jgi:RNA polymerase sigma-70 factor (ECF subfamily)
MWIVYLIRRFKITMMLDDKTVKNYLTLTAQGNAGAFSELYSLCAPTMLAIALRIVSRRELAEEVLHDVFVKVWHKACEFDPKVDRAVAWIAAMTRNRALDLVASANVARVNLIDSSDEAVIAMLNAQVSGQSGQEDDPHHNESGRQYATLLHKCLQGLNGDERQTVVLGYFHGLSHHSLAEHFNRPLGTIKTVTRRALAKLKTCVSACIHGGVQ